MNTDETLQKAADLLRDVPETQVPTPTQLIQFLRRNLNMTEIAELVNEGKRNSVYHWRKGTKSPQWDSYIKLLYAAGFRIVKKNEE